MNQRSRKSASFPGLRTVPAFSIVELALALGVLAFSLVALMALLPLGLQSNRESAEETEAASWMTMIVHDFRAARTTTPSPVFGFDTFPYDAAGAVRPGLDVGTKTFLYLNPGSDPVLTSNPQDESRYLVELAILDLPQVANPANATPAEVRISLYWPVPRVSPANLAAAAGRLDFYLCIPR